MSLNDFILSHRTADVHSLALSLKGFTPEESRYILYQVEGWQRLKDKVPSWAAVDELHYPARLPLEQCSGEEAARYKAGLLSGGDLFVDLTGGLGVAFGQGDVEFCGGEGGYLFQLGRGGAFVEDA